MFQISLCLTYLCPLRLDSVNVVSRDPDLSSILSLTDEDPKLGSLRLPEKEDPKRAEISKRNCIQMGILELQ